MYTIHREDKNSGSEEEVELLNKEPALPKSANANAITLNSPKSSTSLKSHLQNYITTSTNFLSNSQDTALGVVSNQLMKIHEAFAADDVVKDFIKEKQEVSNGTSKDVDLSLPGKLISKRH